MFARVSLKKKLVKLESSRAFPFSSAFACFPNCLKVKSCTSNSLSLHFKIREKHVKGYRIMKGKACEQNVALDVWRD